MNILIVGTGALATLFAARLSRVGHSITMLGTWKHGLDALHENGVRLIDSQGKEHQYKVHATDDPRECVGTKYALVLVKAWQTERVAGQLAHCLVDDGLAITLQNGLGNYETLTQSLDLDRVALGTTTTGATLLGPGLARAGGEGIVSIQRHQAVGPIEEALQSAGFHVQLVEDARSLVWGKLVINAAINPLTAILRVQNGALLERPPARELMGTLAKEAAQVALAEKITLPFSDPVSTVEDVARKTAQNHSSMLQDVLRNATTEIDAINGAVVQAAQKHNLETPFNWVCWNLVKSLTR
jgi:2-dehydropantoate 2-reductase